MKSLIFLFVLFSLFVFSSCDSQDTSQQAYDQSPQTGSLNGSDGFGEAENPSAKARVVQAKRVKAKEVIAMHPETNPKSGAVSSYLPLPSTWKLNSAASGNQPYLTGPGGVKAFQFQGAQAMYVDDPYTRQAYQQTGQAMQAPVGLDYIVRNELTAMARKFGLVKLKDFPLPKVAQKNLEYMQQLESYGPRQNFTDAAGAEYRGKNGNKVLLVAHYSEMRNPGFVNWFYYIDKFEAPEAAFAEASGQFLFGLANREYDKASIQNYNMAERRGLQQRDAAFQNRMRENQRNFEARQRTITETNEAINQISMEGYRNRNAMIDRGHDAEINAVHEENTVQNPWDGNSYQVESGAMEYWMNSNGEYIPSNDVLYDPNTDPDVNQSDWQQVSP